MIKIAVLFLGLALAGCQPENYTVTQQEYTEKSNWKHEDGVVTHSNNWEASASFEWKAKP